MQSIGVRELRQHASRWLARVASGERLQVTDRGRAVALLIPVETDPWEALQATGRLRPSQGSLLDEPPRDYGLQASAALEELRRDER